MTGQITSPHSSLVRLNQTERRIMLIVVDLLVSYLALLVSLYLWAQRDSWLTFSWKFLEERPPFWFWFLPFIWILLVNEIYDLRKAARRLETLRGIVLGALVGGGFYLVVFFLSPPDSLPRQGVAIFILAAAVLTLLWRFIYIRVFTGAQFMRRVLVVGAGRAGSTLCSVLAGIHPQPFELIGLVDDDPSKLGAKIEEYPVLGSSAHLEALIQQQHITDLVFAISGDILPESFKALVNAQEQGIEIRSMPSVYEELLGRVPIFLLQADWIIRSFVDQAKANGFFELVKRFIDIISGFVGCIVLIFLFPVISGLILLETGRPVIFTQRRLGKNGKEYRIIKFRTMVKGADKHRPQVTTTNDSRITRIGRILRKSHLDEWPQFLNVLNGDMSLVGPRAEQTELVIHLQSEIPFYRARLLVKPGITGWAQVNFGYASTVEDTAIKLEYDLYYIKHRSLLLDILIMLRTFGTMVGFRGQ